MRTIFKSMVITAMLLGCFTSRAHDIEVNGIYYNIVSSTDFLVEVTYRGNNYNSYSDRYIGSVSIPSIVTYNNTTYRVVGIEEYAFSGCSGLTSISIPKSVTEINNYAFDRCSSLKEVLFEDGCETLSLGYDAYSRDFAGRGLFYDCSLEYVYIGRTLEYKTGTSYGQSPFAYSYNLESVIIGDSVTTIGPCAFWSCISMESIIISESVNDIGTSAFNGCSQLLSIIIPEGITCINGSSFLNCSSLISVTIPESVTKIETSSFAGCSSLTSIIIPKGVRSIEASVFSGCSNLISITIPKNVTNIGEYAFKGCRVVTSITIPSSVTSIGNGAFDGCSSLSEVVFADSQEKITLGIGAYSVNSSGYKSGKGLFYECPLDSVYLGRDLTYSTQYGNSPFYKQDRSYKIAIGEKVTSIGDYLFSGNSYLTSVKIPRKIMSLGNGAFNGCSNINKVLIEDSQKTLSLGTGVFSGCSICSIYLGCNLSHSQYSIPFGTSLTEVIIGDSVTNISASAFRECEKLTFVVIPDCVTSIDDEAFSGCIGLTSLPMGKGVETIGGKAFYGCNKPTSIVIPCSVKSIGIAAFDNCISIKEVFFEDGEETLSLGYNSFNSNDGQGLFYDCPLETIYLGRTLSYNSSSDYGYSPFYNKNKTSLTSVTIGDRVISIGRYAFYGCNELTSIVIPDAVTSIGSYAFNNCGRLTSIVIPDAVTSIGSYAFYYCSGLESAVIGNGVTEIGSSAFNGCTALTNLTIGSSVSSIGSNAFAGCNDVESIYALNTKAITCDESIFATDAYNNAILYVPSDRVFAYEKATPWKKFQIEPMKKFTITYIVDGQIYKTEEIESGTKIVLPETPTKEGHTFLKWNEVPETMPTNNITVYGIFSVNKYLVTFKVGDKVIFSEYMEYGANIVVPEVPEKEGHTFNGWSEVAETVPACDAIYEGTYTVNFYKLTFIIDSEVVQESSIAYGATITLPEEPKREGYSFDGWNEVPETMPAEDVTVYGTFTKLYVETVTINDSDNCFSMAEDTEYGTITYTRTFNNTNWQALYVPFEIPYGAIGEDFDVAYIYDARQYDRDNDGAKDEIVIEAFKISEGVLEANYPYVIRAKETGEKSITVTDATLYATEENSIDCSSVYDTYTFTGTYSSLSSDELTGCYALSGGMWQPVLEGTSLGAFRFYLKIDSRHGNTIPTQAIKMRIIEEDGNTSTEKLELKTQNSKQIIDLQGRRVESPTKGIYIINGKKVVIK